MPGLFGWTRQNSSRPVARRHARLRLESLEGRDVPSTVSLAVSYGGGRTVTLSGTLSGHPNPSMQMIDLGGKVSGMTMTNSQGQYSVTLQASALGAVTAAAHDGSSDTAELTLTDVTPALSLTASEGANHVWTLSGHLDYGGRSAAGMLLFFDGVPVSLQGGMLTTSADGAGDYEVHVTLNGTPSDNGLAWARAVTTWGTSSPPTYDDVVQTGT